MQTPVKTKVPTKILSWSCVGFTGEFPRGYGNYITTVNDQKERFAIVNLSHEDLEDAIKLGLIGDDMEADVYAVPNVSNEPFERINFVAFITDPRLPEKCLAPEHWYNSASLFDVEILKKKYSIPKSQCLCENESLHNHTIFWTVFSRIENVKKGKCRECNKAFEKPLNND